VRDKLIITTTLSDGSIPQRRIVAVRDGAEMDLSGLITRFNLDYPADDLGVMSFHVSMLQVEHRTVEG